LFEKEWKISAEMAMGTGKTEEAPKKKETNPDPNYSKTSAMPLQVPSS
jgi:hypothetical protein